jgi:hypothetical protein
MTTAASAFPLIGSQPVGNFFAPDTTQRHPLGSVITFNDPFWGGGEAIYLQMPVSTAFTVGAVLAYDTATSFVATAVANTAILGKPLAFLMNAVASNASAQFAWAQISGQGPVFSGASVAANTAIGITAAGQAGANSAGKQITNCRVTKPATTTVIKANTVTQNGSPIIKVSTTDGWFVGVSVSGTGITTSLITVIDPDNRTVTLASNSTATGSVSATGTYNDATNFFNICTFDRPFAQGAIT